MLEQTWDFPSIKDFIHIALVKGLFCLLAPPPHPGAEKIPHILHNLLQRVPAAPANNTPISSSSRQTAPSAAIWAPSQARSNTPPDKAGEIRHNMSGTDPITSVSGVSGGAKAVPGKSEETFVSHRRDDRLRSGRNAVHVR